MPINVDKGVDTKKSFCCFFIAIYLGSVMIYTTPFNWSWIQKTRAQVSPPLEWVGLWQSWNMFQSGRPFNAYLKAEIKMKDQSIFWFAPRMEELGILEKYQKERYRKWAIDNLILSRNLELFKNTCQYLGRQYFSRLGLLPKQIYLTSCGIEIPPPGLTLPDAIKNGRCLVLYKHMPIQDDLK